MSTIVVGIDGSVASRHALRWAAVQAERTEGELKVVMTNPFPETPLLQRPPGTDPLTLTRRTLERITAEEMAHHPGVTVQAVAREGPPAKVLLEEAAGAELLVVGSRGLGGFSGLMLGSVSFQCVAHAPCPVVVVR